MKKICFSLLFSLLALSGTAQWSVGIRLTPGINATRIQANSSTLSIDEQNKPIRMMVGILLEKELRDNYFFTSGINFFSRKYSYSASDQGITYNDDIVAQYLQLPVTMKLHTNEIMLDMNVYFQLGASLDVPVDNNLDELTDPLVTDLFFMDLSLVTSAGIEYKLGTTTRAFGGLYYNRSFLDQARKTVPLDTELSMRSSLFGLELGIIF